MRTKRLVVLVLFAATVVTMPASAQSPQTGTHHEGGALRSDSQKVNQSPADPKVNAAAVALLDFKARIDRYVALRKKAASGAPSLKETKDPAKIKAAEEGQAATIRAARADARPGDIFTTEIQTEFHRLLAPELKQNEGAQTKQILKDDAPGSVPLKVNAKYPDGKPLPTVPSNLLLNLPPLPPEVEYRIVGRNLILRDTGADLIVDFMLNAIK